MPSLSYEKIAYLLFGKFFLKRRDKYYDLRKSLLGGRTTTSVELFMSTALLTSLIMAVVGILLGLIFLEFFGIPEVTTTRLAEFEYPEWMDPIFNNKELILAGFVILFLALLFSGITYVSFLLYPRLRCSTRRRNIDATLPYAVNYIASMSRAGVVPVEIFSSLANSEMYGESAVEARYIVREIKLFGEDLITALKNVAATTPSTRLQEFLQGIITTITSGGELAPYLKIKTEQYMLENRRQQKEFLDTLGLIAEAYVTAFVAGPLFLIVMMSIMMIMSGGGMLLLQLVIYLVIPVGSLLFVILVDSITPEK